METAPTRCAEMALLIQAEIDGELDAAQAATVVQHRQQCAQCGSTYSRLLALREQLRGELQPQTPTRPFSDALRARLAAADPEAMQAPTRRPISWKNFVRSNFVNFGAGAALAAALAFILIAPAEPDLADAVMAGHIRSLQAEHLLDVVSTDQHTVKPWFNGKLDFAPPIIDLAANGFPLSGGRLDYLAGRTVAALVYHHNQHPINLFVWPNNSGRSAATPKCVQRAGYHLCSWSSQAMNYWAISDLNAAELNQFANYWLDQQPQTNTF